MAAANETSTETWSLSVFLLSILASVLSTLIVLMLLVKFSPDVLPLPQAEIAKIRVVDMVGLSMKAAELYPSEAASDAALQRVFDRLKGLHEDGYIILASQQVISAPESLVLSTDDLLKEDKGNTP